MTTTYTAYAGDTQQIEIDVGDEAGAPLDMSGRNLVVIGNATTTGNYRQCDHVGQ